MAWFPVWAIIGAIMGTAGLALWAASLRDGLDLAASCGLAGVLVALAVIDVRRGILPDTLTLPLAAAGLALAAIDGGPLDDRGLGAIAGYAAFALVAALYRRWRGRDGLGLGDAKLMAAAGAWVGWQGLPSVVLIGALAGLAGFGLRRMFNREVSLDRSIAFGPFLALALWLVWLYGPLPIE